MWNQRSQKAGKTMKIENPFRGNTARADKLENNISRTRGSIFSITSRGGAFTAESVNGRFFVIISRAFRLFVVFRLLLASLIRYNDTGLLIFQRQPTGDGRYKFSRNVFFNGNRVHNCPSNKRLHLIYREVERYCGKYWKNMMYLIEDVLLVSCLIDVLTVTT